MQTTVLSRMHAERTAHTHLDHRKVGGELLQRALGLCDEMGLSSQVCQRFNSCCSSFAHSQQAPNQTKPDAPLCSRGSRSC